LDISYFANAIPKYFGDKIATIRVGAAKLYSLLTITYELDLELVQNMLAGCFYGEGKNWF
jgi:hypothetical protein